VNELDGSRGTFQTGENYVTHVAISPNRRLVAQSGYGKTVKIWDARARGRDTHSRHARNRHARPGCRCAPAKPRSSSTGTYDENDSAKQQAQRDRRRPKRDQHPANCLATAGNVLRAAQLFLLHERTTTVWLTGWQFMAHFFLPLCQCAASGAFLKNDP
jgi:hypothetical protein